MPKTVILNNPFGTDCTNFLNGKVPGLQLLKGTILLPGDTLWTNPYNNTSGIANIVAGVANMDAKLRSTSGEILVFSYSEGCQIADMWLTQYGMSSPITPTSRLSFLSIGNANSPHGGFVCGHSVFNPTGFTQGLPKSTLPYYYRIFARQYDGVGDFPTDITIQNALVSVQGSLTGATSLATAVQKVAAAVSSVAVLQGNIAKWDAAENAVAGIALVHNFYENVVPNQADPTQAWYTDPVNGVQYGLAMTYPVPLLGVATLSPSADKSLRALIETCYARPYKSIPQPDYPTLIKHWGFL